MKPGDLIVCVKSEFTFSDIRPISSYIVWTRNGTKEIEPGQVGIALYVNQVNGNLEVLIDGEVCQTSVKRWKLPDDWMLQQWEDRVKPAVGNRATSFTSLLMVPTSVPDR